MSLLIDTHPEVAAQWHPTRNSRGVEQASTYSNKKVWWLHADDRGDLHEWTQIIRNRTIEGTGCTTCRRSKRRPGTSLFVHPESGQSLAEARPDLARWWHPSRNGDLTPADITHGSVRRVWFRCPDYGCEFIDSPYRLSKALDTRGRHGLCLGGPGTKGPSPTRVVGERPDLMAEWHPGRNGNLDPHRISTYSTRKVWWFSTACRHEWCSTVRSRAEQGGGCPRCKGRGAGARFATWKVGKSKTLAEHSPDLVAEWHPSRNGDLTPDDVSYGSATRVWWLCPGGHAWSSTVNHRTARRRGCWCCANPGSIPTPEAPRTGRSVAEVAPTLSGDWHPHKNGHVSPWDVAADSDQVIFWKCAEAGHEWKATAASRVRGAKTGSGCRACANKADRLRRDRAAEPASTVDSI